MKKLHFILIVSVLFAGYSCKDEKKLAHTCGYNVEFNVPVTFPEGEDLTIYINDLADDWINTYYVIRPANEMDIPALNQNGFTYTQDVEDVLYTYEVPDFGILDEGEYTLRVYSGNDKCENTVINKSISLIPKTSPCKTVLSPNTIYVSESIGATPTELAYLPSLQESPSGDEFLCVADPGLGAEYEVYIAFYIGVPEKSSTYTALDWLGSGNNSADDFDRDARLYCDLWLGVSGYPGDHFRPELDAHNVYVERTTEKISISFCEVKFTGDFDEERYVSTVFEHYF